MDEEKIGKVTLAPGVLTTIVRLTVLADKEVARLCRDWRSDVGRALGVRGVDDGVRVDVQGNSVAVDVHLVAAFGANLLRLGRRIQDEVDRAISETVGLVVREVNVYIEDVELPQSNE